MCVLNGPSRTLFYINFSNLFFVHLASEPFKQLQPHNIAAQCRAGLLPMVYKAHATFLSLISEAVCRWPGLSLCLCLTFTIQLPEKLVFFVLHTVF